MLAPTNWKNVYHVFTLFNPALVIEGTVEQEIFMTGNLSDFLP